MKQVIIAITSFFLLSSCGPKLFPLVGKYPQPPIFLHSNKTYDEVWDNLIDVFAQKGFSIKVIDRSSGLIVSERKPLAWTMEDKRGALRDPHAIVVLPEIMFTTYDKPFEPVAVYGEWNVRVKRSGTGSDINVNLLNFYADYGSADSKLFTYATAARRKYTGSMDGVSTGLFEKSIADAIR